MPSVPWSTSGDADGDAETGRRRDVTTPLLHSSAAAAADPDGVRRVRLPSGTDAAGGGASTGCPSAVVDVGQEVDENVNNVGVTKRVVAGSPFQTAVSVDSPSMPRPSKQHKFTVINYGRSGQQHTGDDDDSDVVGGGPVDDLTLHGRSTIATPRLGRSNVPSLQFHHVVSHGNHLHADRQTSAVDRQHWPPMARENSTAVVGPPGLRTSSSLVVVSAAAGNARLPSSALPSNGHGVPGVRSCSRLHPPPEIVVDRPDVGAAFTDHPVPEVGRPTPNGPSSVVDAPPEALLPSTARTPLIVVESASSTSHASSRKSNFWNRRFRSGDHLPVADDLPQPPAASNRHGDRSGLDARRPSAVTVELVDVDDEERTATPEEVTPAAAVSSVWTTSDREYRDVVDRTRLPDVAKRGRLFAKRYKKRLIMQSGVCNISYANVERRGAKFLLDIFTTLLEIPWKYNILVYLVTFVLSWMLFGLLWWATQAVRGANVCVDGVDGFLTALLFSIETQHTIGYGSRAITDRCPEAVVLLMLQSVFGAVTQCIVTGIIFAKMARPTRRAETVMFSRKAVINRSATDGSLCLSFRVGDVRSSQLIGVDVNALLVSKVAPPSATASSSSARSRHADVDLHQQHLRIATESDDDFFFLAWPIRIVHRIDATSPLWQLSPEQLLVAGFEILVILEACCESTGATTQVRTSYLPSEILWGHDLAPLVTYQKDNGRYKVDFSRFHEVVTVDTPEMSARDLYNTGQYLFKPRQSMDSIISSSPPPPLPPSVVHMVDEHKM